MKLKTTKTIQKVDWGFIPGGVASLLLGVMFVLTYFSDRTTMSLILGGGMIVLGIILLSYYIANRKKVKEKSEVIDCDKYEEVKDAVKEQKELKEESKIEVKNETETKNI
jgi:hypothetical protein